jgi:adenylate kinase
MRCVVIVTGTPGTGKTTVAMRLAKKAGWKYVDVNKVISHHKLSEGYDRKRRCKVVDVKKLNKALTGLINGSGTEQGIVIDSHLSHHLPASAVDACVVTKCNLKLLKNRMKRRKYPVDKIKENLECEIMDVCLNDASEAGHNVFVVETDKKVDYTSLMNKIKKGKTRKKKETIKKRLKR